LRHESPHKLPAKLLKSTRQQLRLREIKNHTPPSQSRLRPGLQGPRSIAPMESLSTHCHLSDAGVDSTAPEGSGGTFLERVPCPLYRGACLQKRGGLFNPLAQGAAWRSAWPPPGRCAPPRS
jgi:hypothetical protein